MRRIRIIAVGRLKRGFFGEAAEHYLKSLSRYVDVDLVEIKDAPAGLGQAGRVKAEGEAILARLGPTDEPVCLDERGIGPTSRELAKRLEAFIESPGVAAAFIIGGPFGLSDAVRARCRQCMSLGPMTLPHELARVVLLEQLYRAATILKGLPYHHD